MSCVLHHGDCRDVLKTFPDCSVDSIVTDPPYELGFMGKSWDASGIAYSVEMWREVLRVLKPGGHLCAFGGTRTYHRMAVAIEDAGFEIRDSIHWLYGSGFPKSLDVSKAIDKMDARADQQARRFRFTEWVRSTGVTAKQIDEATGTFMGNHYTTHPSQPYVMTREHLEACRHLLGDVPAWVERECDIRSVESRNFAAREVLDVREMPDARRVRLGFVGPTHSGEDAGATRNVAITAPATDAAKQWEGWGTALKPAHEPIVLARKPLVGTVAANVLQHGMGALNIDGCRVATTDRFGGGPKGSSGFAQGYDHQGWTPGNELGRWPANIVFTHAAECQQTGTSKVKSDSHHPAKRGKGGVSTSGHIGQTGLMERSPGVETVPVWACVSGCPVAALDEQSGISKSQGGRIGKKEHGTVAVGGAGTYVAGDPGFGDTGGASRFFTVTEWEPEIDEPFRYVAKPSKAERNAGLDGLPKGQPVGGADKWTEQDRRKGSGITRDATANTHPTVKPVALMRWLVRLVTPPNGTVLDPFAGSGTTLVAATLEGFHSIGIEMTAEYLPIIEGRVAWAESQPKPEPQAVQEELF